MNKIMMSGNICNEIELKQSGDTKSVGIRLAVKRPFKSNGQYETDFISMTAFGSQAELLAKYSHKGDFIIIQGRLQNNNYDKDGKTVYQDKVIIESVEFGRTSHETEQTQQAKTQQKAKPKAQVKQKEIEFDEDEDFYEPKELDNNLDGFDTDITVDDLPF